VARAMDQGDGLILAGVEQEAMTVILFIDRVFDPRKQYLVDGQPNPDSDYRLSSRQMCLNRYTMLSAPIILQQLNAHDYRFARTCQALDDIVEAGHEEGIGWVPVPRLSVLVPALSPEFLTELFYVDHKLLINAAWTEYIEQGVECPVCDEPFIRGEMITCADRHFFCRDCTTLYMNIRYLDHALIFTCLQPDCQQVYSGEIEELLLAEDVLGYLRRQRAVVAARAEVDASTVRLCPHCGGVCVRAPGNKACAHCDKCYCHDCGRHPHEPFTCVEISMADLTERRRVFTERRITESLVRSCVGCGIALFKVEGCERIHCRCGRVTCYVCGEESTSSHYATAGCNDRRIETDPAKVRAAAEKEFAAAVSAPAPPSILSRIYNWLTRTS